MDKTLPCQGLGPDENQHCLEEKAWSYEKFQKFYHFIYDHGQLGCLHFFYKWEVHHPLCAFEGKPNQLDLVSRTL